MYDHFLITRFNLKKDDWVRNRNKKEVLDDDWLEQRIELFQRFCLPSVLNQRSKGFKWLLFFEKKSEKRIQSLLISLQYDFIEILFVEGYEDFHNNLPKYLKRRLSKKNKILVTTRLDNDDALHENFMKTIQRQISSCQQNTILHFPFGLCLDIQGRMKLATQYHPMNQFITLVERAGEDGSVKGVYFRPHNMWEMECRVITLKNKNLWLQITHSGNMSNEFTGNIAFSYWLKGFFIRDVKFPLFYDVKVFLTRVMKRKNYLIDKLNIFVIK